MLPSPPCCFTLASSIKSLLRSFSLLFSQLARFTYKVQKEDAQSFKAQRKQSIVTGKTTTETIIQCIIISENIIHDIPPYLSHTPPTSQVTSLILKRPFPGKDHVVASLAQQDSCTA